MIQKLLLNSLVLLSIVQIVHCNQQVVVVGGISPETTVVQKAIQQIVPSAHIIDAFNGNFPLLNDDANNCEIIGSVWGRAETVALVGLPASAFVEQIVKCDSNVQVIVVKEFLVSEAYTLPNAFWKNPIVRAGIKLDRMVSIQLPQLDSISEVVENYYFETTNTDAIPTVNKSLTIGDNVLQFNPRTGSYKELAQFLNVKSVDATLPSVEEFEHHYRFISKRILLNASLGLCKAAVLFVVGLFIAVRIPPIYKGITILCQIWFGILLAWTFLTAYILGNIIHIVPGIKIERKESFTMMVLHYCFVVFFWLQPWIRIRKSNNFQLFIDDMRQQTKGKGGVLFMNHTSMLDSMLMCYLLPLDLVMTTRTLAKEKLFRPPVLGAVFRMVGHFPVYFKNDVDFTVDKEKQAEVTKRVKAHLDSGGTLTFCPEGMVNRDNPSKLKSFRRGSFLLASEYRLPAWNLVTIGNYVAWPPKSSTGGYPCVINVGMSQIRSVEDWNAISTGKRTPEVLKEEQMKLCEFSQHEMQSLVDELFELRKYDRFYKKD